MFSIFQLFFRLKATDWGSLDVLILDLPPGTGDVQLAVLQTLQLSGAIAVTTPSSLAQEDTKKGIEMFTSLGVPTLAVVENMAHFTSFDEQGRYRKHSVFGSDRVSTLDAQNTVQLSLSPDINECNECKEPLVLKRPERATADLDAFHELGLRVSEELLKVHYGVVHEEYSVHFASDTTEEQSFELSTLILKIDKSNSPANFFVRFISNAHALQRSLQPARLRSLDPKTGETIENSPFLDYVDDSLFSEESVAHSERHDGPEITRTSNRPSSRNPPSILPVTVERRGRYGFAVEWGDGATIIYSLRSIAIATGATVEAVQSK